VRIALVVHDFSRRLGHGRYTVELAERFRRDHEVHVFANTVDSADTGSLTVHRVPAIRANALTTILSFPIPATARVGRDWDVIHAQGLTSLRFNVVTAHICNAAWARAQRTSTVARTWRQRAFEKVVTSLEGAMYRRSTNAEVIAISSQLKSELAHYYARHDDVSVIHHGVDSAHFQPHGPNGAPRSRRELMLDDDGLLTLFVGDLRKGGAVALDILSRVPAIRLVMVSGSDPEPYRARAALLGVSDRVTFRAAVRDLTPYYGAADIFLFPSPYDAFGMVALEAMASGLPVITSRQAGVSELIRDGDDGFVVASATDGETFATRVTRLCQDRHAREAMGRAARKTAEAHSWDSVARETMKVYERALARAGRHAS
jgi:UDP-glucose:(heptosyl)LPS alpha-1,3-glucosyltransferase